VLGGRGAFWSGETLRRRLPKLIGPPRLYDPFRVDCASYRLSIGSEVYISPSEATADRSKATISQLGEHEGFKIPPGQFAFLVTEEVVTVPCDALAFISIRARTKFKGLVNVSGFHVDPGYNGQITFAVFNAGPVEIHLKRGDDIFLIWFASLDRWSRFTKSDKVRRGIESALITEVIGRTAIVRELEEQGG
jgi:dCTP deaminase